MRLIELLQTAASNALGSQRKDGSLPAGNNGPHGQPETPVRNTAHWLVTFAAMYRRTGAAAWRRGVRRAAEFLVSPPARPYGFSFHHRDAPGRDRCNGLIGTAWVMEALAAASNTLGDDSFANSAEEVFFKYPFDATRGLWQILEIDGRVLRLDQTFNHQLWFAAAAALLPGRHRPEILSRVERFLSCCDENLTIHSDGLIYHLIPPIRVARSVGERIRVHRKRLVRALRIPVFRARRRKVQEQLLQMSIGYHAFNLYAFAMLHQQLPGHSLWRKARFRQAVAFLAADEFAAQLEGNPYGFPYNPPGLEVPFALSEFSGLPENQLQTVSSHWLTRQLERTLGPQPDQLGRNNPDPITLTARLYEANRLPDWLLSQLRVGTATSRDGAPVPP